MTIRKADMTHGAFSKVDNLTNNTLNNVLSLLDTLRYNNCLRSDHQLNLLSGHLFGAAELKYCNKAATHHHTKGLVVIGGVSEMA